MCSVIISLSLSIQVLLKAERISTILQIVLPNGQLNFMNHKVIRQIEKQVDSILSK